nr:hypothetical protein [Tanacetum cinerariifolium]
ALCQSFEKLMKDKFKMSSMGELTFFLGLQKVFANMRRVGKGFSGVETPLFESMLVVRDVAKEAEAQVPAQGDDVQEPAVEEVVIEVVPPTPTPPSLPSPVILSSPPNQPPCPPQPQDAEGLENDKAAQQLEIVKLKARVKKLEKINMVKSSKLRRLKKVGTSQRVESLDDMENVFKQGRIIADMDQDKGIELVADQEKDAEVERRHADKQAELYNLDLVHSSKVLSMQEDDTEVQEAVEIVTTAKLMTKVVTATTTQEPQYIKRYHRMKKKPQTESKARKNMIFYLKNTKEEDQEIIKSINETPAQKAAKRRKLSEEAQDLRKRLKIVQDKDDDVFVEATPLAQKVPIIDYQMVVIDNKPRYPLSRFTLEQLVNVARLQVEEESKMSLELLREMLVLFGCYKSDAAEGFEKIIDLLSRSYIHYALTVSPPIYISCIKQFWNSVLVKRSGDVTRLQALVYKKKIVISEAVIHEILKLNNAEGVVCLPNEEIFAGLAQMGYEKPSTKLTFYKAFFSSQWKFLIHTILQSLSAKKTSWNEFSTTMASAVISLSKGQNFNFSKYIFDSLVHNVDSSSKVYMYPRFIQLIIQNQVGYLSTHTTHFISPALTQKVFANMRRVGKGFSGVETPLFEGMIADRQPAKEELGVEQVQVDAAVVAAVIEDVAEVVTHMATPSPPPHGISSPPQEPSSPSHQPPCLPQPQDAEGSSLLFQQVLDTCSALARRVEGLENDKAAQQLEIVKLKARVKKLEKINMVKSSKLRRLKKVGTSQRVESSDDMENVFNQGRKIADMDQDEGIELLADQEKDAEFEGRHADKQAEIYNIDLDHSSKVLSMQEDDTEVVVASRPIPAVKPKILNIAVAHAVSTRRRKGIVIRDPEEEFSSDTPAETPKVKDKGKGILIEAPKPMKKKDQIEIDAECARKLQEEINKERYKMDFFKGKKYDEILPIFQAKFDANMRFLFKSREEIEAKDEEIIKSINETPAQKAAKRRKLSEKAQEAKDLRIDWR